MGLFGVRSRTESDGTPLPAPIDAQVK